jgi:hypothetical protein
LRRSVEPLKLSDALTYTFSGYIGFESVLLRNKVLNESSLLKSIGTGLTVPKNSNRATLAPIRSCTFTVNGFMENSI